VAPPSEKPTKSGGPERPRAHVPHTPRYCWRFPIELLLLIVMGIASAWFILVPTLPWSEDTPGLSPAPTPSPMQSAWRIALNADRGELESGYILADSEAEISIGETYTVSVLVCGPESVSCSHRPRLPSARGPVRPSGGSVQQWNATKIGARVRGSLTTSGEADVRLGTQDAVQPVTESTDEAEWTWYVRPKEAGVITLKANFTVLQADTDAHLRPETHVNISLTTTQTLAYRASQIVNAVRGSIAWSVTIVSGLGVTGAAIFAFVRRCWSRRNARVGVNRDR
jgi:hypothetical protein